MAPCNDLVNSKEKLDVRIAHDPALALDQDEPDHFRGRWVGAFLRTAPPAAGVHRNPIKANAASSSKPEDVGFPGQVSSSQVREAKSRSPVKRAGRLLLSAQRFAARVPGLRGPRSAPNRLGSGIAT